MVLKIRCCDETSLMVLSLFLSPFPFLFTGWHEEMDRNLSSNSLGDQAKFGSKTALNRRVSSSRHPPLSPLSLYPCPGWTRLYLHRTCRGLYLQSSGTKTSDSTRSMRRLVVCPGNESSVKYLRPLKWYRSLFSHRHRWRRLT